MSVYGNEAYANGAQAEGQDAACGERLTARRREILNLLCRGLGNKQIARQFIPPCSEATVKAQLKLIYAKLGVHNRAEAAAVWVSMRERHAG